MKKLYSILLLLIVWLGNTQNPADRDPNFNQFDLPINNYFVETNVTKSLILPDGKILIVEEGKKLVKLNGNLLDTGFNTGIGFSGGDISDLVVQPDGRIIVVGAFRFYNSVPVGRIVRLFPNGEIDATFNLGGTGFNYDVARIALQQDDKIIVAGGGSYNGGASNSLTRLNTDGSIDNSFVNGYTSIFPSAICIQTDGKIIVSGKVNSQFLSKIVRLNSNGSLDTGFQIGTLENYGSGSFYYAYEIVCQSDSKIVVVGNFYKFNGIIKKNLIRLSSDGSEDTTFITGNSIGGIDTEVNDVKIQSDGKILLGGKFESYNSISKSNVVRINSDGSLDSAFNIGTGISQNVMYGVTNLNLFSDERVLVTGGFTRYSDKTVNNICILNPDGTLSNTFKNICKGFDLTNLGLVKAIATQPDGKIIVGGSFNAYNGNSIANLVRLNVDGSYDGSLTYGGVGFYISGGNIGDINAVAVQNDGKIIVGGDFISFNGSTRNRIIRLNPDGTRDTSFVLGSGFNYAVNKIIVLQDGKILVAGDFTTYQGISCTGIVRLNSNGSRDAAFNISWIGNGGGQPYIKDFVLQPDSKILVVGNFSMYLNSSEENILRINSDGSRDLTFVTSSDTDVVRDLGVHLQQNGKIIVGRNSWENSQEDLLYRLNSDGSIDTSFAFNRTDLNDFNVSENLRFFVTKVTVAPDDKFFVSGYAVGTVTNFRGYFFRRMNNNGAVDNNFTSTPNYFAEAEIAQNGRLFLSDFGSIYRGVPARSIIRLLGDEYYFVQGQNKLDGNLDGCDSNDSFFSNLNLSVSSGLNTINYIGNNTGNYRLAFGSGSYTITPVLENPAYFTASPNSVTVDFPSQTSPLIQNFCITPNGVHPDLEVALLPINQARPGFDAKYKLVYKNKGNQVQSGSVDLIFNDEVLDVVSSVPTATSQAVNTMSWSFTNLNPYETKEVVVTFNLNTPTETPALNGGDVLNYSATISSAQTDETQNDNIFVLNQAVVNSYDPNDKTCLQGTTVGTDKVGEYVHYVIRFENTGTYNAQNITVTDFIDTDKFDVSTLVPVSGSHLFTTKISQGNKVEFVFENINLPFADATNDGYVAFKIKTKSALVPGDTFSNGAGIYFDYNYPITTNTYTTTIQTLSTQDFSFGNYFSLYPNPVSDVLNINKKEDVEIASIQIYNVMGQLMMVIPNAKNTTAIDVSHLASGNYFVKINSDKGTSNTKFIKK